MTRDHAAYTQWDASYVLGALTPSDRSEYEAHLEECDRCRASLAELASMPGLLSRARPLAELWGGEFGEGDVVAPPSNLVDLVEQRRARELRHGRTLRRRMLVGAAGVAAAVALAIAVPIALTRPTEPATVVALGAVADSTMSATAGLTPAAWGTSIDVTCDYPAGTDWGGAYGPLAYELVVTDRAGNSSQVSTWTAVPGKTVQVEASTSIPLADLATIEVRSASGVVILAATLDE